MDRSVAVVYVVATPIGNLEDITLRALRVLKEVHLIACEDTRHTQKLLNHYGISTKTISYHEHNEKERALELLQQLQEGKSIAVVSDAGMPGISDPGYCLISLAIQHQIPVIPVPGPVAFVAALAASGLPADSFQFHGFLPAKIGQRRRLLEEIRSSQHTEIFYEAPHRLLETLKDMADVLGAARQVVIAREITKIHEELLRGGVGELLQRLDGKEVRGEITLLIAKAEDGLEQTALPTKPVRTRLEEIMREQRIDQKSALKVLAKERGVSKSEVYREMQRNR